jgi:RNA polymerase sigma-70 factor (ECF subfamily)
MIARAEPELLDAARAGEAAALEELMTLHMPALVRFASRMCRDPEDAKDVVQDTLLSLARGVGGFRGDAALSTWLFTVARNHCLRRHRSRPGATTAPHAELDSEEATAVPSPEALPDAALEGRRIERALEEAIGELDPMYREVLVLRDAEGLTAPEVAQVLGVTTDAVKSRLHRARLAVRARLAPVLGADPSNAPQGGCPDVLSIFSRHLEDELSADACAEMERHLAGCERCRGACDSLRRTLALCKTQPTTHVPAFIQDSVRIAMKDFLSTDR